MTSPDQRPPAGWYNSPRWSNELLDCSMPLTMDTYSICSFDCLYCFSYFQRSVSSADYLSKNLKWVNPEKVKRMFADPDRYAGNMAAYIKAGKVMQWGGLSDQFDEWERKYGITLDLLRFFRSIKYPLSFSTKATWWLDDPRYRSLFEGADNWHLKMSIITPDPDVAKRLERGVPSPQDRIEALGKAASLGLAGVTLRLRPYIVGISDRQWGGVPGYEWLIREAAAVGVDSVSTEFFCVEGRTTEGSRARFKQISELAGYDVLSVYRKHSKGSGYMRLSRNAKRKHMAGIQRACDTHGLSLFVSDAHFKELSCGGSCCGLPASMNYSRGQFTQALVHAKEHGTVRYSDISEEAEFLDAISASKSLHHGHASLAEARYGTWNGRDWLRFNWNTPTRASSPAVYFGGVLVPDGLDDNGDIIYRYDQSKSL